MTEPKDRIAEGPPGLRDLSGSEARRQLERDGPNELPKTEQRKLTRILAEIVSEPMVFLLIGCGGIYLILGDRQEAVMLLGFLGIILGITLYQENKTERALEALRDLSSPRALVLRDGEKKRIPGRDVVRGDIILLSEGDRVPADAELLFSRNLSLDESLLTGESVPVSKLAKGSPAAPPGSSRIFAGSTVVMGSGLARVSRTGSFTELGKIGRILKSAAPERTKLQEETKKLVKVIAGIAAALCVLVVIAYGLTRRDWLGGFLAGLTLAMAILPNELPAVLTIFLALGAWRLSRKRVLTRRTPAIEALGTATVLCVDKTGTLTYNRMALRKLFAAGTFLDLVVSRGRPLPEEFHELVEYGILAGETEPFDPMEKAFRQTGNEYLAETEHLHPDWTLLRQYPLSPELLALSHVWKTGEGKEFPIAAKGAPEAVVDLCHLSPENRTEVAKKVKEMAAEGLRVLAVAKARFTHEPLPEKAHDFDFELVGLVGLQDPVRSEVPRAVEECHRAGIRVIMITGDHPETAQSIAREIRLPNPDAVLTGDELKTLSDRALSNRVKTLSVCARMVPEQKLRLIQALKSNGEVVAMTGDGVNDAPALKSAHIGIAMGNRGTDVARESASLVLLDDDFASIVSAIRMGRRIYDNLQHAMSYLLAVHIPITGISVIPVFFNLPLVLMPVHIAFLHLIIEPACSVAFEAEPEDPGVMRRPPRRREERLFSSSILIPTLLQGISVLGVLMLVFLAALSRGLGEADARTLAFTSLIVANLGLIFTNRSWTDSSFRRAATPNRAFRWVLGGALSLLAGILSVPALREVFRFSILHPLDIVICFAAGLVSSLWFEGLKLMRSRRSLGRASFVSPGIDPIDPQGEAGSVDLEGDEIAHED